MKNVFIPIPANMIKTDNNSNVTNDQRSTNGGDDDSSIWGPELEAVYEQFSKWMDKPIDNENMDEMEPRDEAVLNFANSLLKRTLSESFVGVQLSDNCSHAEESLIESYQAKHLNRQAINARSLSLEVARQKHQLAAQLVCNSPLLSLSFSTISHSIGSRLEVQLINLLSLHLMSSIRLLKWVNID